MRSITPQDGSREASIVSEFINLSAQQAESFGYSEKRTELFLQARSAIAELALSEFTIEKVEDITETRVEELALLASPTLEEKLSESKQERRELRRALLIDPLTGVANRLAYDRAINTANNDPETRVLMFDGDNVGQVNKKSGHTKAGDKVIKDIAQHITTVAEKYGLEERVFRFGGDEFVVLADKQVAKKLMKEVVKTFGTKSKGKQKYDSITISITGAVGKNSKKADRRLIKAKQEKKSRAIKK